MKIKAKNGETMFWIAKYGIMISFVNGVADVDDKCAKEMISCGYKQEAGTTVSTPKVVIQNKQVESTQPVKPKFKI